MIYLCALLGTFSVAAEEKPAVNNEIHFRLGAERTSEPFNFFQDGTFAILHQDNKIYVLPPVNNVDTCDQFVWSGSDIENIYPTVEMNGLTANSHYDRGRIYDAYGWWPFTLWSDNNGKWYSYMHTEDAVQVTTGQTGHGSDLRTIALWTSTDNGANWTYEGVALSIDSDYAVPGNLQVFPMKILQRRATIAMAIWLLLERNLTKTGNREHFINIIMDNFLRMALEAMKLGLCLKLRGHIIQITVKERLCGIHI